MKWLLGPSLFMILSSAHAGDSIGTVVMLKGQCVQKLGAQMTMLKEGSVVAPESVLRTSSVGFAKIIFRDKSELSLGPNTTVKLNKTGPDKPQLVTLGDGQVRAKVTKDYLADKSAEPSKVKFMVRTQSATMGVRGTDFQTIYNAQNQITSLVTFEGSVAMAKADPAQKATTFSGLVDSLNAPQAVMVTEGKFSAANPTLAAATLPVKISPAQFSALRSNETLGAGAQQRGVASVQGGGSPIPPGVDAKAFVASSKTLDSQLATRVGSEALSAAQNSPNNTVAGDRPAPPPEGMYDKKTGAYAPPAGGFIDVKSGLYVPPPPGSAFDANTGVFIPPPNLGTVDTKTGTYVPPSGYQLDPNKGFVPAANEGPSAANNTPGARLPASVPPPTLATAPGAPPNVGILPPGTTTVGMMPPPPPPPPPPTTTLQPPLLPTYDPYCPNCNLPAQPPPPAGTTTTITVKFTTLN